MRILVCGGRGYSRRIEAFMALDRLHERRLVTLIIHGAARGADEIADQWARMNNIERLPFPADWKLHGLAAGPLRNGRMLREGKPDGVVAFPGGRGTADMVKQAEAAGVKVWRPYGRSLAPTAPMACSALTLASSCPRRP